MIWIRICVTKYDSAFLNPDLYRYSQKFEFATLLTVLKNSVSDLASFTQDTDLGIMSNPDPRSGSEILPNN